LIGPLALHGGGEFLAGDETFLGTLLALAAVATAGRDAAAETVRVELLTSAVARHRPDMAFAVGSAAFERVAAEARPGLPPAWPTASASGSMIYARETCRWSTVRRSPWAGILPPPRGR